MPGRANVQRHSTHNSPAYDQEAHVPACFLELGQQQVGRNFAQDIGNEEDADGYVVIRVNHPKAGF